MKAKLFLFAAALATASVALAQKAKITLHTSVQAGLLEGERGGALQLQSVQSLNYKTWSAGIGTGLDFYHTRSVPVFLAVRKTVTKNAEAPFVYIDGGYNFPWLTATDKEAFISNAKGGFYYDAGIGYQFPVMKKNQFFFSAGISGKQFTTEQETWIYIDYIWPGPSSQVPPKVVSLYRYRLQRLSIKAGLRF